MEQDPAGTTPESQPQISSTFVLLNDPDVGQGDADDEAGATAAGTTYPTPRAPYPGAATVAFFCLEQTTRPRSWCLRMVCNPWFERLSMLVILLNCVTLGMFRPCEDITCTSRRCEILQGFDDFIFAFFAVEMVIKMVALGVFGKRCYLGDTWNRLDLFIVVAGMLEYSLNMQNVSLSAIRTVRVLRPLRAINRVPSMRILVTLLLDTLPMLGNVLLLCFFVFFIFGIIGVQLWAGLLRNRCFPEQNATANYNISLNAYYRPHGHRGSPFVCSLAEDNGMRSCSEVPPLRSHGTVCRGIPSPPSTLSTLQSDKHALDGNNGSLCMDWNRLYTECHASKNNPYKDSISFDNIGYAWISIFQVITLEGWVDIMYFVMDAHSFYNFIYFILLIIVGSFFMINLCLVVIATQFSETKQRENKLMLEQRTRFMSNDSTLASFSEPGTCYDELIRYATHICRKARRRFLARFHTWRETRNKKQDRKFSWGKQQQQQQRRERRQCKEHRHHSRSIHHLIHHHHHHHHHHYHVPTQRSLCGGTDEECEDGGKHGCYDETPTSGLFRGTSSTERKDSSDRVHSVYHSDCHLEGLPKLESQAISPTVKTTEESSMNYPVILAPEHASRDLDPKKNVSLNPYTQLQHFVSAHSSCRNFGPRVSFTVAGAQGQLLPCRLDGCPLCTDASVLAHAQSGNGSNSESDDMGETETRAPNYARRRSRRKKGFGEAMCMSLEAMGTCLRVIVDSKYFGRGIMVAILINTLSMGIEYHEQPDELTSALEISNVVFTSMFALEMLIKLLAYGILDYIKNPYSIFDGIIVIISVWEIVGQEGGGLSVLRTFRLLRVLKLVRFLPALRRQLLVLMRTMDNVATFCMLLMLFIFIFSILGMHLFGCKFSLRLENGETLSDRKNFDSLLWAIVTVFQILTQEDWNAVLYNGMASTSPWAALYFILLMTFGNYVLFNLLVAILVEGFQAEGDTIKSDTCSEKASGSFEDESVKSQSTPMMTIMTPNGHMDTKNSLGPPIITHTAATPMGTPQGSPHLDYPPSLSTSKHGSRASLDRRSSLSIHSSPCPGRGTSWTSRRASWNSLSRVPSLKKRTAAGERASLLSASGTAASTSDDDEEEGVEEEAKGREQGIARLVGDPHKDMERPNRKACAGKSRDLQHPFQGHSFDGHFEPELVIVGSISAPASDSGHCNGRPLSDINAEGQEDDPDDDGLWQRLRQRLKKYRPAFCSTRKDWSIYLFSPKSRCRLLCERIISHKLFDHMVLTIIFLNCITIALERPSINPQSLERLLLKVSNYVFTVIFTIEMVIKVVALGFWQGEQAYLRCTWNLLDGILVLVSLIDLLLLVSLPSEEGPKILAILRVLRLLRTLRPLRVISRAPGLKLVVETLISSLKPIGNIVLICCAFFIIFGILGVQLFKGKFFHCEGLDVRYVYNHTGCLQAGHRWLRHKYNFDNLGQALMSLFVMASRDGWVDIMYHGIDAVGIDKQPVMNHNTWMLFYFISFLLIVGFFVLNMFVGVVVENFHKCRQQQEEEEARMREERRQKRLEKKRRKAQKQPYWASYSTARLAVHRLCTSHYLDLFISITIGLNVVSMAMEHYKQPANLGLALKYCNYLFTFVFVIEAALKLFAFGLWRFFKERWNQLDVAIVLLSIMGITLEEMKAALPINPTIIRIMRVLRIARVLKLLKMAKGMRALLDTVVQALPQVGNLGLLFMLLFFIYAALGVELFGELECSVTQPCEGLGRHATFKNFGMAFLTLFRVSTGDNWNGIMKDTLRECGVVSKQTNQAVGLTGTKTSSCHSTLISPLYFVTFVLVTQFVLVNVVVAVLMKHLEESNMEAREDVDLDNQVELEIAGLNEANMSGNIEEQTQVGGSNQSLNVDRSGMKSYLQPHQSPDKVALDDVSLVVHDSLEGELLMMDNISGSVCHHYATPTPGRRREGKPEALLAEMEASSTTSDKLSEKSWSLALTDDSCPDVSTPTPMSCKDSHGSLWESLIPSQSPALVTNALHKARSTSPAALPDDQGSHRLGVGRTHSLPNDSYMCQTARPPSTPSPLPEIETSGDSRTNELVKSLQTQSTEQPACFLRVPSVPACQFSSTGGTPGTGSSVDCMPRIPPPAPATHCSPTPHRPLCRQVAVRLDSVDNIIIEPQEEKSNAESLLSPLPKPLLPTPQLPSPNRFRSDTRQFPFKESSGKEDEEVSQTMAREVLKGWCPSPPGPFGRDLKKCFSVDTRGFLARPAWVDDTRRHSIEVCPQFLVGEQTAKNVPLPARTPTPVPLLFTPPPPPPPSSRVSHSPSPTPFLMAQPVQADAPSPLDVPPVLLAPPALQPNPASSLLPSQMLEQYHGLPARRLSHDEEQKKLLI
uniref:voltage-dependent T-type calcium channel subunit alpha-1G-like n=1 Tax=Myxine glutinosa TaxID=7769 RepID=UPI00358F5E64